MVGTMNMGICTTAGKWRMLTEAEISGAGEGKKLIVTDGGDHCCASCIL